uniref:Uncharacterized protein n=1 Tax=Anopheles albimanus TaxID=7167 RepID=A0A182FHB8_ANOAL
MLQINRASMLYPDGEVTKMMKNITFSAQYDEFNDRVLRIPGDCHLKGIRILSARRLRAIRVSGINSALEVLEVDKSAIRRLPSSLQYLQALQKLEITKSILDSFNLEPLNGIPNLISIYLTQNKLHRLEVSKDPMMVLSISRLTLSSNRLEFINMEFFTPLKQLSILDLSGNRLKQIVANIPVIFPSLSIINLAFNNPLPAAGGQQWAVAVGQAVPVTEAVRKRSARTSGDVQLILSIPLTAFSLGTPYPLKMPEVHRALD